MGMGLSLGARVTASWAQGPVELALATDAVDRAWYAYGMAMAGLLRSTLPPGSSVDVRPFSGGVGNPRLVAAGDAELALAFAVTSRWAFEGKEVYERRLETLRALAGGLGTSYVLALASRRLGLASLREISGRQLAVRVYTPHLGSLGELCGRQVLRAHGVSYAKIRGWGGSLSHGEDRAVGEAFKDGRADVLLTMGAAGDSLVAGVARSNDVRFLALEPEIVKALGGLGYVPASLPAGSFERQPEPVPTVGSPTVLIASTALPEAVASTVTRTLVQGKDVLGRGQSGLSAFDPATAWRPENAGITLHPGAERVYREQGWLS